MSSVTISFSGTTKQYDFILVSVKETEGFDHYSVFDSYDCELASTVIKTVSFKRVKYSNEDVNITYDLEDSQDKATLVDAYYGYMTNSPTDQPIPNYCGYEAASNLPSYEEYFNHGKKLVFDVRDSRGYTGLPEPVNRTHGSVTIDISLKGIVPVNQTYKLVVYGVSESTYTRKMTSKGAVTNYTELTLGNKQSVAREEGPVLSYSN